MYVSGIISFGSLFSRSLRYVPERDEEDSAKVVGFPVPEVNETAAMEMQERGQVFAAHRIVSRVADQLESVAAL